MKKLITATTICLISFSTFATPDNMTQTNYIGLKNGLDWTWGQMTQMPKVKWRNKRFQPIPGSSLFVIEGNINKYTNMTVYGTKAKPILIKINSAETYKESEDGKDTYKLSNLFNKNELKLLKSNCTKAKGDDQMNSGEYQHFYKWQRPGYQPLYLVEAMYASGNFGGGISKEYTIAKDFSTFSYSNMSFVDTHNYKNDTEAKECKIL